MSTEDLKEAIEIQKKRNLMRKIDLLAPSRAPQRSEGHRFMDLRLNDIDDRLNGKQSRKVQKKDRDYIRNAHIHLFAESPKYLARIKDLRAAGAERNPIGEIHYNSSLLTKDQRGELKTLERKLINRKHFLLKRCEKMLGIGDK